VPPAPDPTCCAGARSAGLGFPAGRAQAVASCADRIGQRKRGEALCSIAPENIVRAQRACRGAALNKAAPLATFASAAIHALTIATCHIVAFGLNCEEFRSSKLRVSAASFGGERHVALIVANERRFASLIFGRAHQVGNSTEVQVNDRSGIQREQLRQQQPTDDRNTKRSP